MKKIGFLPKVQRLCLQTMVPKQETMERQAQVPEMMAPHKGLASHWSILDLSETSFSQLCFLNIHYLQNFINSAESGSEGSSDASDENTNQQVYCLASVLPLYIVKSQLLNINILPKIYLIRSSFYTYFFLFSFLSKST